MTRRLTKEQTYAYFTNQGLDNSIYDMAEGLGVAPMDLVIAMASATAMMLAPNTKTLPHIREALAEVVTEFIHEKQEMDNEEA